MRIKHIPSSIAWMSVAVLLALWIGYVAGGILLQYPDYRSGSRLRVSTSETAPNTEPKPEPPVRSVPQTPANPELPPAVTKPLRPDATIESPSALTKPSQPDAKIELPSSAPPNRELPRRDRPAIIRGTTLLQVAAVTRDTTAHAIAETLNKKGFPAFVLNPSTDKYYRVQIGPFADLQSARVTRDALEAQGFQVFIRPQ